MQKDVFTPQLPPEILLSILKALDGYSPYLLSAALVNKEWFEAATDFLWKEPPVTALAALPRRRRQFYANKIVDLFFKDVEESKFHSQWKNLKFPRLKCLGLATISLRRNSKLHIGQYIGRRLESFSYWGRHPCEDAIEKMELECPRLHDLHLIEPLEKRLNAEKFNKFLRNRTSLRNVELGRGWQYSMPAEVLAQLATLDHLERLGLESLLRPHMVREVFFEPENKFKNLQILHIRLACESVGLLAAAATSVDTLFLEAQGSEQSVLQALEPMKRLRHLEVEFDSSYRAVELRSDGIETLGRLPDLEVLLIRKHGKGKAYYSPVRASWMTDEHFAKMMSSLPKLRSLAFQVESGITLKSITDLSKTHPNMYCCDVFGVFDLDDWAGLTAPIFPNLRRLGMDAPNLQGRTRASSTSIHSQVERIIDVITRQLPMLEQLAFHDWQRNVLADEVLYKYALRIRGVFNTAESAAFRPWSWMEKNRLVISRTGEDHAHDMELIRRAGFGNMMDILSNDSVASNQVW